VTLFVSEISSIN